MEKRVIWLIKRALTKEKGSGRGCMNDFSGGERYSEGTAKIGKAKLREVLGRGECPRNGLVQNFATLLKVERTAGGLECQIKRGGGEKGRKRSRMWGHVEDEDKGGRTATWSTTYGGRNRWRRRKGNLRISRTVVQKSDGRSVQKSGESRGRTLAKKEIHQERTGRGPNFRAQPRVGGPSRRGPLQWGNEGIPPPGCAEGDVTSLSREGTRIRVTRVTCRPSAAPNWRSQSKIETEERKGSNPSFSMDS